jgi:integrase
MLEKKEKVVPQRISGYSQEELKLIVEYLANLPKTGNSCQRNIEFTWMVLLEMFEGMRTGEICALHVEDIIQIDGIPCITVNRDNLSYLRIIPIHEVLLNLNFLEYVINSRNLLFLAMYTNDSSGMAKRKYTRRILNMRKELQLPDKRSFRHNVAAKLSGVSTYPHIPERILGHKLPESASPCKSLNMTILSRELNLVGYGFNIFKILNVEPISDENIAGQIKLLPQK